MFATMRFIDPSLDVWRTVRTDSAALADIAPAPHLLLEAAQWQACQARWPEGMPVGISVGNDADIETLAADLPRFGLVALHFPKWVDGRAYSQAHLLRSRYRFDGEVRATGDVVADMLPLLHRTGFDAVAMRADQSQAVAERALGFFAAYYQGDVPQHAPHFAKAPA